MPRKRLRSGEDIKQARKQLGLSQEATAHLLHVSLPTYSRWERGVVTPSPVVLRGIEGFFDDFRSAKKKGGEN